MSIHGFCFDQGDGGNCNHECERFDDSEDCPCYAEIYESISVDEKLDLILEKYC